MEPIYSTPSVYGRKRTFASMGMAITPTVKRVRTTVRRSYAPGSTRGWRSYGYGRRSLGKRLRNLLSKWSPPERKYSESSAFALATDTIGVFRLMNSIGEGAGPTERVGRRITCTDFLVRLNFTIAAATITDQTIRVMIVYDAQTNSGAPTAAELLANASTGSAVMVSPMNLDNRERFKILAEKQFTMVKGTETERAFIKIYKKIKLPTVYDAGTTGGGSISTGSIYLCVFGRQNDVASTYDFYGRVRFIDN